MLSSRRGTTTLTAAAVIGIIALSGAASTRLSTERIPERIADSTFWRMMTTFSEQPTSGFPSENFVSNETDWQTIIPEALDRVKPGGVYLGVGPEQNFTYIAAFKPKIAFICDIRRQNLLQHLMYKALIEQSADRVDFLSKLWSRRRPEDVDSASTPAEIVDAYRRAKPDSFFFQLNMGSVFDRLVKQHRFALNSEDSAVVREVYGTFFKDGPDISYASTSRSPLRGRPGMATPFGPGGFTIGTSGGFGGGANTTIISNGSISSTINGVTTNYRIVDSAGRAMYFRDSAGVLVRDTLMGTANSPLRVFGLDSTGRFAIPMPSIRMAAPPMPTVPIPGGFNYTVNNLGYATFASLMTEDDGHGENRGWLGSEKAFQWLKDFESRNLLIPVVGDVSGPKALRSIAAYLKAADAPVSAYYMSNVEQYLFQNRVFGDFYDNVAELPTTNNSLFIRSFPPNSFTGLASGRTRNIKLVQTTSTINGIVSAYRSGLINNYQDLQRERVR